MTPSAVGLRGEITLDVGACADFVMGRVFGVGPVVALPQVSPQLRVQELEYRQHLVMGPIAARHLAQVRDTLCGGDRQQRPLMNLLLLERALDITGAYLRDQSADIPAAELEMFRLVMQLPLEEIWGRFSGPLLERCA